MKKPFILLWGLIAGVFLFSWIYLPALSKYQDLKVRQEGMDLQIKELEEKLADIQEERNLLKNDVSYLEKTIRDELGLVKPGEIVYKFVQDKKEAPIVAAKKIEILISVFIPERALFCSNITFVETDDSQDLHHLRVDVSGVVLCCIGCSLPPFFFDEAHLNESMEMLNQSQLCLTSFR